MSNIGDYISRERYEEMFRLALKLISEEYIERDELLKVFRKEIGLTDAEIDFFGYDFSDLEQEEDTRFSIIHLHDFDEDYCITSSKSYDLYDAAEIYHKYMKADVGKLTLDSLAHWFDNPNWIDERLYPILCQSLSKNGEISTIINFDFANEELIYSIDSELRVYDLEDVSEAYEKANQNNGLCTATRKNIFYENILGKEIECSTESDEEESPSMSM